MAGGNGRFNPGNEAGKRRIRITFPRSQGLVFAEIHNFQCSLPHFVDSSTTLSEAHMPEKSIHALEAELQELVKRSRTLSLEMSQISERMLAISAEIVRLQTGKKGELLEAQRR
jgi:hypothetical protein